MFALEGDGPVNTSPALVFPAFLAACLFFCGCSTSSKTEGHADQPSAGPVIGQLETRNLMLVVYNASNTVTYTVATEDGTSIAEGLTAEDLLTQFPELKPIIEQGYAGNDARLMPQESSSPVGAE
jgi:hypothetical protein